MLEGEGCRLALSAAGCYMRSMPLPDLTPAELAELVALLRAEVERTRWPLAPRNPGAAGDPREAGTSLKVIYSP